jgi:hypothetical protein
MTPESHHGYTAVPLHQSVPATSLSAAERALAVAHFLLPAGATWLHTELEQCRELVADIMRRSGARWQARDVARFVRRDVNEFLRALKALQVQELANYGELPPAAQACLSYWLARIEVLANALERLAYEEPAPEAAPALPQELAPHATTLSRQQQLHLCSAVQVARECLASIQAWLEAEESGVSPALRASFDRAERQAIAALCIEIDLLLGSLLLAFGIDAGPPPWRHALAQRLLEASGAISSSFEVAVLAPQGQEATGLALGPALGFLAARLKRLHRLSLPPSGG